MAVLFEKRLAGGAHHFSLNGRAFLKSRARHRPSDDAVDDHQRGVDARRPEMAGHRFGECGLRHLALRRRRGPGRPAARSVRDDDDDRPSSSRRTAGMAWRPERNSPSLFTRPSSCGIRPPPSPGRRREARHRRRGAPLPWGVRKNARLSTGYGERAGVRASDYPAPLGLAAQRSLPCPLDDSPENGRTEL